MATAGSLRISWYAYRPRGRFAHAGRRESQNRERFAQLRKHRHAADQDQTDAQRQSFPKELSPASDDSCCKLHT
jgi:hypothetical protein